MSCSGDASSANQDFAEILVPAGFTVTPSFLVNASGGKSWTASLVSGTIRLAAGSPEGQNRLVPSEAVSVTFTATAPSSCAPYTWTTSAFKAPPSDTAFSRSGAQPVLTVTGCSTPASCTLVQGYWQNHPSAWPVNSLMLGSVNYTDAQLLAILGEPTRGNGLVSLAHQLIAAKLNVANGASAAAIASTISAADALIGGLSVPPVGSDSLTTSSTEALRQALTDYNDGQAGVGTCGN